MNKTKSKPMWARKRYVQKESWRLWREATRIWLSFTFVMIFGERPVYLIRSLLAVLVLLLLCCMTNGCSSPVQDQKRECHPYIHTFHKDGTVCQRRGRIIQNVHLRLLTPMEYRAEYLRNSKEDLEKLMAKPNISANELERLKRVYESILEQKRKFDKESR